MRTIAPHFRALVALLFLATFPLNAQQVRVGSLEGNLQLYKNPAQGTIIDWTRGAFTSGTVNTASVGWANATTPCEGIFFVRFYVISSNAFSGTMTAERGPFRAVSGINTVALNPPVQVFPETHIGIYRVPGPDSCGQPFGTVTRNPGRALYSDEDYKNGSLLLLSPSSNFRLHAQASNAPSVRVATIPVVGSTPGGFGSFFRTSLTLANPGVTEIRGKLVLRLAGRSGSDADPSIDYVIPRLGTLNYADILAALGQSGQGSLDILTTASPTPIASARVFNDAGAAGTNGLSEEAVPAAPNYYSVANVLVPEDLGNFRVAVGVRTFAPVDLTISVLNAAGDIQRQFLRSYPADYFVQVGGEAFIDGALPAGGRIVVTAFEKEFIVYGTVTDNRTNDPSMRVGAD
jgi:hypothetical protein